MENVFGAEYLVEAESAVVFGAGYHTTGTSDKGCAWNLDGLAFCWDVTQTT